MIPATHKATIESNNMVHIRPPIDSERFVDPKLLTPGVGEGSGEGLDVVAFLPPVMDIVVFLAAVIDEDDDALEVVVVLMLVLLGDNAAQ